jgi:hypothetical protein
MNLRFMPPPKIVLPWAARKYTWTEVDGNRDLLPAIRRQDKICDIFGTYSRVVGDMKLANLSLTGSRYTV